ncbi:helix-turn-helix transcriptional regulator [Paenibacillus sp. FSL W8-1187]|uniref:helix-turn-helix domain-containing protein n=1 Tax=Paenibacillus sp. FSL W8-1187 TaxID=2975339 RepID=UPI0030DD5BCE
MTTSNAPGRIGLGGRLRVQRQRLGWTQQQLADELSVAKSTVSQYENSVNAPDYDMLVRLCRLFGVSSDHLLGLSAEAAVPPSLPRSGDDPLAFSGLRADEREFLLASLEAYRSALRLRGF